MSCLDCRTETLSLWNCSAALSLSTDRLSAQHCATEPLQRFGGWEAKEASAWTWLAASGSHWGNPWGDLWFGMRFEDSCGSWEPPQSPGYHLLTTLGPRWTCGEDGDCWAGIGGATLSPLMPPIFLFPFSIPLPPSWWFSCSPRPLLTPCLLWLWQRLRIQESLKWVYWGPADLPFWEGNVLGTGK